MSWPAGTNPPLRQRSTADLIVLALTAVVALVVVAAVVGAVVWKINDPDADLADLVARVGDLVNTLIGAIVGYLAGKGAAYATTAEHPTPADELPPDYGEEYDDETER